MSYRPTSRDELRVIAPLGAVRRNASRLFRSGSFTPIEATGLIVEAALLCGVGHVEVLVLTPWTVVSSHNDWLVEDGDLDVSRKAFSQIQSFKAGGVNSMRPEVLLLAYGCDVFTISDSTVWDVTDTCQEFLVAHPDLRKLGARVVGFRHPISDE